MGGRPSKNIGLTTGTMGQIHQPTPSRQGPRARPPSISQRMSVGRPSINQVYQTGYDWLPVLVEAKCRCRDLSSTQSSAPRPRSHSIIASRPETPAKRSSPVPTEAKGSVLRAELRTGGRWCHVMCIGKFWTARSRLYGSRFLHVNIHFAGNVEISNIGALLRRSAHNC